VRLIDNNSNNPVGTALSGRGFTLPTQLLSRSRATFQHDIGAVIRNYERQNGGGGAGAGGTSKVTSTGVATTSSGSSPEAHD
jgi:hypothetical protein